MNKPLYLEYRKKLIQLNLDKPYKHDFLHAAHAVLEEAAELPNDVISVVEFLQLVKMADILAETY